MFYLGLNVKINSIAEAIYTQFGPGLPDKVYKESFINELEDAGVIYEKDSYIPIDYKGRILDAGLYACFIIDSKIVLYIKSASTGMEFHKNQLYHFMELSDKRCGMILDFNSKSFDGVMRVFIRPDLK